MQWLLLLAMLIASGSPEHASAADSGSALIGPPAPISLHTSQGTLATFVTEGESMSPTIESGDMLSVDSDYYYSHSLVRGDIIVFRAPDERNFVKRVVGLPGETIRIQKTKLFVNGKFDAALPLRGNVSTVDDVKLSGNQLYALGDNYAHSYDSRYIGPVGTDRIIGKVVAIEHKTMPKRKSGSGK